MNCPVCPQSQLTMTNREGIEIDYCPQCRGIWLDRGELDKIIERSVSIPSSAVAASQPQAAWGGPVAPAPQPDPRYQEQPRYYKPHHRDDDDDDDHKRYRDDYRHGGDYRHHKKKRGGFLGELFDFD